MKRIPVRVPVLVGLAALLLGYAPAEAQQRFGGVVDQVNRKMVKIFGAGGFKGLAHYGTGIVVSADGYVLTAASHILDSQNVRVHMYDGRRADNVKVIATEPELDLAVLKIDGVTDLPFFDIEKEAQKPMSEAGNRVLAFSNQFEIATRNEPMTVQQGTIASYSKLHGRRGINEAPFTGDVYFVDAITNNPGAAGGALTTRKGELLGIVGKELRNSLTDTWVNYALPVQAKVEVTDKDGQKKMVSVGDFVRLSIKGEYKPSVPREKLPAGAAGFTGIILVPDVVKPQTPPFVEDVRPGSPAHKAGVRSDDLIVYVDGELALSVTTYNELMSRVRPGTEVTLDVRRGDKLRTIKLKVEEPKKVAPKK
jgi:serine protease Do